MKPCGLFRNRTQGDGSVSNISARVQSPGPLDKGQCAAMTSGLGMQSQEDPQGLLATSSSTTRELQLQ